MTQTLYLVRKMRTMSKKKDWMLTSFCYIGVIELKMYDYVKLLILLFVLSLFNLLSKWKNKH